MIVIFVAITFVIAFFLGRASIKLTYGGKLIITKGDADSEGIIVKRFLLDVQTDLDKLDQKKHVIFEIVPTQPTLL